MSILGSAAAGGGSEKATGERREREGQGEVGKGGEDVSMQCVGVSPNALLWLLAGLYMCLPGEFVVRSVNCLRACHPERLLAIWSWSSFPGCRNEVLPFALLACHLTSFSLSLYPSLYFLAPFLSSCPPYPQVPIPTSSFPFPLSPPSSPYSSPSISHICFCGTPPLPLPHHSSPPPPPLPLPTMPLTLT